MCAESGDLELTGELDDDKDDENESDGGGRSELRVAACLFTNKPKLCVTLYGNAVGVVS